MAKDIQQLKHVQRCAARFVKKDYRYTTSVTGLLDKLGWLPLFECRKHSRYGVCRAMLCISAAIAGMRCLSVCLSHS